VNGVYGSIISAFPEQLEDITYFDMAPKQDSGYGPRTSVKTIEGVIQCTGGRQVKDSNGNLVVSRQMQLWSEEILVAGRFIEFQEDGLAVVYRISGDNEWKREAGFTVYPIHKVVGANGNESNDVQMKTGTGAFA
jgi:hypothetical protein